MSEPRAPYWRLSSVYFFYFTAVGIILPYWGLYLDYLQFTPSQIGVIVAIPMVTKIVAPNIWGWLADRSGQYLWIIRVGALLAAVLFTGVIWRTDYWGVLLFALLFTFFWNAILPQFEVLTLDALGDKTHNYSRVRLWGSIGFIFSVVVIGWVFDVFGVKRLPWILWGFLLTIVAVTWVLPNIGPHTAHAAKSTFGAALKNKWVRNFLVASILLHISHGVFYGFYSLHLADFGYSKTSIGLLWAVGVVAEIGIFIKIPTLFAHVSLKYCYLLGFGAAVIRWLLVAYFPQITGLMVVAQGLHALTFGVTHAVGIEIVRRVFANADRGKAQALYSALCFGAGGALGAFISGLIWNYGSSFSFLFASVTALAGLAVVYWGMQSEMESPSQCLVKK